MFYTRSLCFSRSSLERGWARLWLTDTHDTHESASLVDFEYYGAQVAVLALACCAAIWGLSARLRAGARAPGPLSVELMPAVFIVPPEAPLPEAPPRAGQPGHGERWRSQLLLN